MRPTRLHINIAKKLPDSPKKADNFFSQNINSGILFLITNYRKTTSQPFSAPAYLQYAIKKSTPEYIIRAKSFPLYSCGGLARDIVNHAVNTLYFVDYSRRNNRKHVVRNICPIGGHAVYACNRS